MKKVRKVVGVDHPVVQKKIEKSLKLSVREGSLASVSSGFGLSYISPFALAMNATSAQIGVLHAVISLLPSVVQLKASTLLRRFSRKKIVLTSLIFQTLLWIPIVLTGVLFYLGVPHMVWVLIGLIGLFYGLSAIMHPAWFSWMGSLVPEDKRGYYFSKRNGAAGFAGLVTMVVGALILDYSKGLGVGVGNVLGYTLLGFGILFSLAFLVRLWSWTILARQYEPRLHVRKKDGFSFWQFLKRAPETPFGRFALFRAFFFLVVGIAGPFWAVYMIRDLGFSYMWFMAITVSSIVFQLIFLPVLGKVSDRFGNVRLMRICSGLIFITPVLWLVSALIVSDFWVKIYLLLVPAITNGFAWAGFNLATNNYVYDAVKIEKRAYGVSYMDLIAGLGTFVGAMIGSGIAFVGVSFMSTMLFLFAVSAVGRLLVAVIGMKFLREVRHVKKFSSHFIFDEFKPMQGVVHQVHHLEHLVKKVEHYI